VSGYFESKTDPDLLNLSAECETSLDAEVGLRRKLDSWSKFSKYTHLATEQRSGVLTTELGDDKAIEFNTERTTELANMPTSDMGHLMKIRSGMTQRYSNMTQEIRSQVETAIMTTIFKKQGAQLW